MRKTTTIILLSIALFSCKKERTENASQLIERNKEYNRQLINPDLTDQQFEVILKNKLDNLQKLSEYPHAPFDIVASDPDAPTSNKEPAKDCNGQYASGVKSCDNSYSVSLSNADAVFDSPGIHSVTIASNMIKTARHNYATCLTVVMEVHNSCH